MFCLSGHQFRGSQRWRLFDDSCVGVVHQDVGLITVHAFGVALTALDGSGVSLAGGRWELVGGVHERTAVTLLHGNLKCRFDCPAMTRIG